MDSDRLSAVIDLDDKGPKKKYHGVDEKRYDFLQRRLTAFVEATATPKTKKLPQEKSPINPSIPSLRARRSDFSSLQEWTERDRKMERVYDAKRRARKREEGSQIPIEERRKLAVASYRRAHPPPSSYAMDTVICAMEALQTESDRRDKPASGALAELGDHLKSRIARLKETVQSPR